MRRWGALILISLSTCLLSACKSLPGFGPANIANFEQTLPPSRSDELEKSEVMLHESDLHGDPLYVIMGIDVVHRDQLQLRQPLTEGIYAKLSETWVKVRAPDTKTTRNFREEIERSINQSSGVAYLGEQKVNYILSGRLELSNFKERYNPPSFLCTSMRDNCKGTCEFEAQATLSLEAESLPEKRRSKKWILKTTETRSFDADRACPRPNMPGEASEAYNDMLDDIIDDIVDCSEAPLQDYFASRGYIINYYSDGLQFIFEISGGEASGFSVGDDVLIERLKKSAESGEATLLGSGEVVNVGEKHAYISVPNQTIANQIRQHDRVRLKKTRYIPQLQCKFVLEG